MSTSFFDGFERLRVDVGDGVIINAATAGQGPAVLLLHGFPQNIVMWRDVAATLAENYTVVVADLRGYGDSSKPESDETHAAYSFRAMAEDQFQLMRKLGHERFSVVGHDRGGRTAQRLTLDHSEAVERLVILDILPTKYLGQMINSASASEFYHLSFLIQPHGLAETLVAADPGLFLKVALDRHNTPLAAYAPEAVEDWARCMGLPGTIHAIAEDYRAAVTIDLEIDQVDDDVRISQPLLILWGSRSHVGRSELDPIDVWKRHANDVSGHAIEAGHFFVDERPAEVAQSIHDFFTVNPVG